MQRDIVLKMKNASLIRYQDINAEEYRLILSYAEKCVAIERHKAKIIDVESSDGVSKCRIVVCNMIKMKNDQFCKKHCAILRKMGSLVYGNLCSMPKCHMKVQKLNATKCNIHLNNAEMNEEESDEDDDDTITNIMPLNENQKFYYTCRILPVLENLLKDLLEEDSTVYVGATSRGIEERCKDNDHFKDKPATFFARSLVEVDSIGAIKHIEHFSIAYLARKFGAQRMLNKVGGGGGVSKAKKHQKKFTLYALIWHNDAKSIELAREPKTSSLEDEYKCYTAVDKLLVQLPWLCAIHGYPTSKQFIRIYFCHISVC